ncbi:MAG: NAD(P)H-dependent oxidoreductase [archaeon]|nr:NAD(P)H-dependent oxidoreductase [archaeon]
MTVTIVISSPRKGGFGDMIAERIISGIVSKGKDVKVHRLNEMVEYRQCQNCEVCKGNGGKCVLKDDISPIIDDIRDSEGIVHVTSINFNEMNGLFKMYFDRLYAFLDISASTIMPKGKKIATVVTASADQASADRVSKDLEKVMVEHFFCEPVGRIGYCTWMMPMGVFADESVLEDAEAIGKMF